MLNKTSKKKIILISITTVFGLIIPNTLISFTSGFQKDFLAYNINDFNKKNNSVNDAPFVRIKQRDDEEPKTQFNDLYNTFYYNSINYGIRQYVSDEVIYGEKDNSLPITLHTQSTYSITSEDAGDEEKSHRIDNGLFHAYYGDELLPNRSYLNIRNGDDSFCYISDSFADVIIKDLGLETGKTGYEDLILNHSSLKLSISGVECLFSINNVVYTTKRSAPRCCQFNNMFCVAYISSHIKQKVPNISSCFEIDFKNSAYCITSVLDGCETLGYSKENYNYSFFKKSISTSEYQEQANINERFQKINSHLDTLFICVYVFALSLSVVFLFFIIKNTYLSDRISLITFAGILLFLTIVSIISSLTYIYFIYTLCPLFMMTAFFLAKRREIINEFRFVFFREKNRYSTRNIKYCEIKI